MRALNSRVPAEAATWDLGWLLASAGEYSCERAALVDVLPLFKAALAIRERLAKADPENAGWQRDLSVSHIKIGDVLVDQGNVADALAAYKAAGRHQRTPRQGATAQFFNWFDEPFPGESTHEFCQARRRSGIAVTSKLARGPNISLAPSSARRD